MDRGWIEYGSRLREPAAEARGTCLGTFLGEPDPGIKKTSYRFFVKLEPLQASLVGEVYRDLACLASFSLFNFMKNALVDVSVGGL